MLGHTHHDAPTRTERRRSPAVRILTPALALLLIAAIPLGIVHASEENDIPASASRTPIVTPTVAATAPPTAAPPTVAPPTATPRPTEPPKPTAPPNPVADLALIGDGGAVFYAPNYDWGGWDAIIRTHLSHGQASAATFPYSPEGYYCVHPDFAFGNVLTLQNPATGKTIRCTVADAVAPYDQPNWRRHCVIEISYALYTALGLDVGNHVTVWAMR